MIKKRIEKLFIESKIFESPDIDEDIFSALKEYCIKNKLPIPTEEINSGSDAVAYDTTDPDKIIRVSDYGYGSHNDHEYLMQDLEDTGGVAKIYFIGEMDYNDDKFLISVKEKVDEFVQGYILRSFPEEEANKILYALNLYYSNDRNDLYEKLETLKSYEETQYLYNAIENGLPLGDISPDSNLGVTSDGRIVAFDC